MHILTIIGSLIIASGSSVDVKNGLIIFGINTILRNSNINIAWVVFNITETAINTKVTNTSLISSVNISNYSSINDVLISGNYSTISNNNFNINIMRIGSNNSISGIVSAPNNI